MSPEETTAPSEGILNMETSLSQVEDMDHITTVDGGTHGGVHCSGWSVHYSSDNQDCQEAGQYTGLEIESDNLGLSGWRDKKPALIYWAEDKTGNSTWEMLGTQHIHFQQLDNLWYKIKHDNKTSKMLKSKHRELILSLKELLWQKQELKWKPKPMNIHSRYRRNSYQTFLILRTNNC